MVSVKSPGFLPILQSQLESLPLEVLESVNRTGGLEVRDFMDFVLNPRDHAVVEPEDVSNEIVEWWNTCRETHDEESVNDLGMKALWEGRAAQCLVFSGDPNDWCKTIEGGKTWIETKLPHASWVKNVWVVVHPSVTERVKCYLACRGPRHVRVIPGFETFQLKPDNTLDFMGGKVATVSCGDGDVVPALLESGTLDEFVKSGGECVFVSNAKNLAVDPYIYLVGRHIKRNSRLTWEVVHAEKGDEGDVLVDVGGSATVVGRKRVFASREFPWTSTGTYVFDPRLPMRDVKWSWVRTRETKFSKSVVSFKRSACDLTAAFDATFVNVPRYIRYCPVSARIIGEKSL